MSNMQNTQNLIDEVKKEIEVKELAIKKLKIHEMLELIAKKEKEWGDKGKELNALKEQLDKGDFSAVEIKKGDLVHFDNGTYMPLSTIKWIIQ